MVFVAAVWALACILWVQAFGAHTISRRIFNVSNLLQRRFPATRRKSVDRFGWVGL